MWASRNGSGAEGRSLELIYERVFQANRVFPLFEAIKGPPSSIRYLCSTFYSAHMHVSEVLPQLSRILLALKSYAFFFVIAQNICGTFSLSLSGTCGKHFAFLDRSTTTEELFFPLSLFCFLLKASKKFAFGPSAVPNEGLLFEMTACLCGTRVLYFAAGHFPFLPN